MADQVGIGAIGVLERMWKVVCPRRKTSCRDLGSESRVLVANCGSSVKLHGTVVPNRSPTLALYLLVGHIDEPRYRILAQGVDVGLPIEPRRRRIGFNVGIPSVITGRLVIW